MSELAKWRGRGQQSSSPLGVLADGTENALPEDSQAERRMSLKSKLSPVVIEASHLVGCGDRGQRQVRPSSTRVPRTTTVSAIVVNWNGGDHLLDCLDALQQQSRPFDEIIVVDNDSRDGSMERALARFGAIRAVRNAENLGFGAGVNRGAAAASGEWLALINNDTVANRRWLEEMLLEATSAPDIGMVAGKVYLDLNGRVLDKIGHRIAIDGQNFGRGHRMRDSGQYDALRTVSWPDGCAGLWRRSVFDQVGGVDESFFAYADDADLGIRFRLAGWRCGFAPRSIMEHRHSGSLGAYSPRKLYLVERNRIWLSAKYFPYRAIALNPVFWTWRVVLTALAARKHRGLWAHVRKENRFAVACAILRAQAAGWRGLPAQLCKRRRLEQCCGKGWQRRFRSLFREAHVSLSELAHGEVH
jgi:GT2 family glycosyltransferase